MFTSDLLIPKKKRIRRWENDGSKVICLFILENLDYNKIAGEIKRVCQKQTLHLIGVTGFEPAVSTSRIQTLFFKLSRLFLNWFKLYHLYYLS